MTTDLADELERLAKEATPGEWVVDGEDGHCGVYHAENCDRLMDLGLSDVEPSDDEANAALIVALRNALPAILSALRGEGCSECQAVSAAIGSVEFMDPPDGGDVPLSEQVRRMRAALTALRGEELRGIERFTDSERLWLITAANLLENNPDKPGPSPFHDHQVMARKLRQMAFPSPSPERN